MREREIGLPAFVRDNIARYGLLGSNNRRSDCSGLQALQSGGRVDLTRQSHFQYGFDSQILGARPHRGARYWTEYGNATRDAEPFEVEIEIALDEIYKNFGRCCVNAYGGYSSQLFTSVARRGGFPCDSIRVVFDDDQLEPLEQAGYGRQIDIAVDLPSFAQFAMHFAQVFGGRDVWSAIEAFASTRTPSVYVFAGYDLRVGNNSFDSLAGIVGPPSWCLIDNERFSALFRWSEAQNWNALPSYLRWSPELIASQLASPENKEFIINNSSNPNAIGSAPLAYNRRARLALARRICPASAPGDMKSHYKSSRAYSELMRIDKTLRFINPGYGWQHRSPLDRLFAQFRLPLFLELTSDERVYGNVS